MHLRVLVLALAFLPTVAAEHESGCTQANPCPWPLTVTANGFDEVSKAPWNWTAGTWVQVSVLNDDDADHQVQVPAFAVNLTVPSLDIARSAPFNLSAAGLFEVRDATTGALLTFRVTEPAAESQNPVQATKAARNSPGLPFAATVALLALAALSRKGIWA